MGVDTWTYKNIRDCGTQVRQPHLTSHLQNFEVKNKTASSISEEIQRVLLTAYPTNRTLKKSTQTGRYGPWDKQGNIRLVLNSKNKRKYCAKLIKKIKNHAEFDKIFDYERQLVRETDSQEPAIRIHFFYF